MSVVAIISNAENETEEEFNIPVATEQFFHQYWVKAIKELKLEYLSEIEIGLEFNYRELPFVIEELKEIAVWTQKNLEKEERDFLLERIDLLIKKLPDGFKNKNNKIFIG